MVVERRLELLLGLAVGFCRVGGSLRGVDHVGEGALEAEGDQVDDVDVNRDEEASGALVPTKKRGGRVYVNTLLLHTTRHARGRTQDSPEGSGREGHGAPDVHRVAQDVEGETLDAVAHEDPEVVPEERACDAEGPGRRDDERLAEHEEHGGDERVEGLGEDLLARLL